MIGQLFRNPAILHQKIVEKSSNQDTVRPIKGIQPPIQQAGPQHEARPTLHTWRDPEDNSAVKIGSFEMMLNPLAEIGEKSLNEPRKRKYCVVRNERLKDVLEVTKSLEGQRICSEEDPIEEASYQTYLFFDIYHTN